MTPVEFYVKTYPQLTLTVREGMSNDPAYLSVMRKGAIPEGCSFPFQEAGQEKRIEVDTPAGKAEVLYLPDRENFEYFVRVLAHRCEPVEVPTSMGAIMISVSTTGGRLRHISRNIRWQAARTGRKNSDVLRRSRKIIRTLFS